MATISESTDPRKNNSTRSRRATTKQSKKKKSKSNRKTSRSSAIETIASGGKAAGKRGSNARSSEEIRFTSDALAMHRLEVEATTECWEEWRNYLATRPEIESVASIVDAGNQPALLWGDAGNRLDDELSATVRRWSRQASPLSDRTAKKRLEEVKAVVAAIQPDSRSLDDAIASLAVLDFLPNLVNVLDVDSWQAVIETISNQIEIGKKIPLDEAPVERLLRTVELPLVWSYYLPEVHLPEGAYDGIHNEYRQAFDSLVDGQGELTSKYRSERLQLLAIFTRCQMIAKQIPFKLANKSIKLSFEWFVRDTMRWLRPNRTLMLTQTDVENSPLSKRCLTAAIRLSGDKHDQTIGQFLFGVGEKKNKPVNVSTLPEASTHSEWAENAVLRTGWHPYDISLSVDYSKPSMEVELNRKWNLLSGPIHQELIIDGISLPSKAGWSEVCWHADDDVTYIELELDLGGRAAIQRQWMMDRSDKIVYFADSIASKDRGTIEYRVELPLSDIATVDFQKETREGRLIAGEKNFHLLPLAAKEWRREPSPVNIEATESSIVYSIKTDAQRFYMPLFFDLEPRRSGRTLTWRHLTVAKDRVIEPESRAVGTRVQVGELQWLFFQSLSGVTPRSVLGEHLNCEFYASRFRKNGNSIELISVNAEDR